MSNSIQAQLLADRLRKARHKAWIRGQELTSEQVMEKMFRNGWDRKPNPFLSGELILVDCPLQEAYLKRSREDAT